MDFTSFLLRYSAIFNVLALLLVWPKFFYKLLDDLVSSRAIGSKFMISAFANACWVHNRPIFHLQGIESGDLGGLNLAHGREGYNQVKLAQLIA